MVRSEGSVELDRAVGVVFNEMNLQRHYERWVLRFQLIAEWDTVSLLLPYLFNGAYSRYAIENSTPGRDRGCVESQNFKTAECPTSDYFAALWFSAPWFARTEVTNTAKLSGPPDVDRSRSAKSTPTVLKHSVQA